MHGLDDIVPAYAEFQGKMYAGTLPTDHADRRGEMMFWLFEPDTQTVPDTFIVWLNGGPGCSSFNCGVIMEHSPVTQPMHPAGYCCVDPYPDLSYNQYTWAKSTTLLYVEQPIGTGFSYGSPLPETERDAAGDIWHFMLNFLDVFPHLKDYEFFVMGESYAGMFVPSIAHYFHTQNLKPENPRINLAGAALGNGWIDGRVQGPAVIDYSWWHGLIDEPTRDALHAGWRECYENKSAVPPPPFHPFNVQDDCGTMWPGMCESVSRA